MKIVKNILTGLLLFSGTLFAQQESIFTLYRNHMNMVNPAYAGSGGETLLSASVREQWSGVKDAPETQAFSFGTPVWKNLGLGLSVVTDKTFIERQTFVGVDFSYKLKMTSDIGLYLGLKVAGNSYDLNTSGIQTYLPQSDPTLFSINSFNPNVGVGALLKSNNYFVSLSIPRMLNTEKVANNNGLASAATDRPHIYLSAGYDLDLNKDKSLVLKPYFMARYVNGSPVSIDFNTLLQIQEFLQIGAMYRTSKAFAGLIDFTISKRMMVGYAYEVNTKAELANTRNTNEFFIRLKF
jgi:type IX secretion system PorP/SprF family membrane protein